MPLIEKKITLDTFLLENEINDLNLCDQLIENLNSKLKEKNLKNITHVKGNMTSLVLTKIKIFILF